MLGLLKEIFGRKTCEQCGANSRLDFFEFGTDRNKKYYCENCLKQGGLVNCARYYQDYFVTCPDYQYLSQLKNYSESNQNCRSDSNAQTKKFFVLGELTLNRDFICINRYENLVVKTDDVVAVSVDKIDSLSGSGIEALRILFITDNKLVPCFYTIYAGKRNFFSNKASATRTLIQEIIDDCCKKLKYPVDTLSKTTKAIKRSPSTDLSYDKKIILNCLSNAELNILSFSKDFINDYNLAQGNWAIRLNENTDYTRVY